MVAGSGIGVGRRNAAEPWRYSGAQQLVRKAASRVHHVWIWRKTKELQLYPPICECEGLRQKTTP